MQKLQIPQVDRITRQPAKDSWIYSAYLDNEPITIRTSKHIYNIAHQYDMPVTGGNKVGLRRFFTFGTSPDRYYRHALVRSFGIEEESAMTDDNRDGSDSIDAAVDGLLCAARAALACGKLPRKTRADLEWAIGDVEEWVAGIAEQSGTHFDRYIAGDR